MKDIEEIKRTPGIVIKREGADGYFQLNTKMEKLK